MAMHVFISATSLVFAAWLAHGADGLWQPHSSPRSRSVLSLHPNGPGEDAIQAGKFHADFFELRNEDLKGMSWIEGPGSAGAPREEATQPAGRFARLFERLRWGKRARSEPPATDETPARPRLSMGQKLAQHLRRAQAGLRRIAPKWLSRLRARVRNWWAPEGPIPVFPESEPEDLLARQVVQQRMWLLELRRKRDLGGSQETPVASVTVTSASTGGTKQLKVGPLFWKGDDGFVMYSAEDVETGEELVLKAVTAHGADTTASVAVLQAEASCLKNLQNINTPQEARDRLRFLLPDDTFTVAEAPPAKALSLSFSEAPVANFFLRMPKPVTTLLAYLQAMEKGVFHGSDHRPLQHLLTLRVIRLAAILQTQGLVHGGFTPDNLLMMPDGRLMLSGFGVVRKNGSVGPVTDVKPTYAPPGFMRGGKTVKYTYALNAWQLGLTIHQIWCSRLPFRLKTPGMSRAGNRPSMDRPGYNIFYFDDCDVIPSPVEGLIKKLLHFRGWRRMLALSAFRSSEYEAIRRDVDSLFESYKADLRQEEVSAQPQVPRPGRRIASKRWARVNKRWARRQLACRAYRQVPEKVTLNR
ncbi:rhoptry kinase family protein (incomplete catalytic triad) [Besnoitia besnoiti]|uniref:Rhoptry kinase family protein (Incomplete catalytic triad) n=1 Tax=Besnoitia besnoiti TaxID=94643 RepID=A0A2A9MN45_BESBE|nr:rhoptry kinase family protein (incomplete catalytic triad) [Besnoitia besnoiti]PFH37586.1 rhoptry kinase family protein (incomplete catalytic triad) [Besnoitia besnoiti]